MDASFRRCRGRDLWSTADGRRLLTGCAEMKWITGWSTAATFEGEFSNVTRSYARYAW